MNVGMRSGDNYEWLCKGGIKTYDVTQKMSKNRIGAQLQRLESLSIREVVPVVVQLVCSVFGRRGGKEG